MDQLLLDESQRVLKGHASRDAEDPHGRQELVGMLRPPKFQEIMKTVMTGGQADLEKAMKDDEETYECVTKLNQIMARMNQS